MENILILSVAVCVIYILIALKIAKTKENSKKNNNPIIQEEKVMDNDKEMNSNEGVINMDEEKVLEIDVIEMIKFKKPKSGSYRNYPTQDSLRQIIRKKPSYLVKKYVYSGKSIDEEKLEVENSKYRLIEEREQIFFNKKPLPNSYLRDEVVLMPKNANTLFAYWEIREETYELINQHNELINDNPMLVLLNLNNNKVLSVDTFARTGSMYINNVEGSSEYISSIGFVDNQGNFIEVATSTPTIVPNPHPSNNFDITWGVANVKLSGTNQVIDFKTLDSESIKDYASFMEEFNVGKIKMPKMAHDMLNGHFEEDMQSSLFDGSSFLGSSFTGSSEKIR